MATPTPLEEGWRYKAFSDGQGGNVVSGTAALNLATILVPYAHTFRKAVFGCSAATPAGSTWTMVVMREVLGVAAAKVASFTDVATKTAAFIEDNVTHETISDDLVGPAIYTLLSDGDNAGDDLDDPCLSILVTPTEQYES